jgi:integrase
MACIVKRRDRWVIDAYDQHGKRYRKTLPAGTTKGKAKEILREIEEKIERRTFLHEKKTPTFQEVAKQFLEYKKPFLRVTTWEITEMNLRNHFDDLNNLKISQVSIETVEKFIRAKQDKGMNINTLRKIIVLLNQTMAYATRHKLIDANPVRDAERPRSQGEEVKEKTISVLNPDQIRYFLEAETDQKYKALFLTAIMTGARQVEILGLRWSDIDFQKKQIAINRTFNMGRFFTPRQRDHKGRLTSPLLLSKNLPHGS